MGARLMAGQQTLNLYVEVRLLCPQLLSLLHPPGLNKSEGEVHKK